ncbi:hypothetical protein ACQP1O_17940 [Nocardia sp. CA-151230]|uniref:hypothetical protein n=1 Tax=Nocardia sp. CA-151230 TaxID=3239982 RepID=UPI003D934969
MDRNVPLLAVGASEIYLMWREAGRTGDPAFRFLSDAVAASFTCYLPVILFACKIPQFGLLVIPETVASLAMAAGVCRDFFRGTPDLVDFEPVSEAAVSQAGVE